VLQLTSSELYLSGDCRFHLQLQVEGTILHIFTFLVYVAVTLADRRSRHPLILRQKICVNYAKGDGAPQVKLRNSCLRLGSI
jgi:hypothetical protein